MTEQSFVLFPLSGVSTVPGEPVGVITDPQSGALLLVVRTPGQPRRVTVSYAGSVLPPDSIYIGGGFNQGTPVFVSVTPPGPPAIRIVVTEPEHG